MATSSSGGGGSAAAASDAPARRKWHRDYPMHWAVFSNDVDLLQRLLRDHADAAATQDMHGNTPLHLAAMLGHGECVRLLLDAHAPVRTRNANGWNALMEAVAYGHRPTVRRVLSELKVQSRRHSDARKVDLLKVLSELGDFYLELKWDFHSWIPLLSRMLPSDVCKIYKRGTSLRLDTTLVDFRERSWQRGDISFVYDSQPAAGATTPGSERGERHTPPATGLTIVDRAAGVYQRVQYDETDEQLEQEVDVLMGNDLVAVKMSTKTITFHKCISGWFLRHPKTEQIGNYMAEYYNIHGLCIQARKRREHLHADDIKKNKAIVTGLQNGTINENDIGEQTVRQSLPPPPPSRVTFGQYCGAPPGKAPNVGRPLVLKENTKQLKAKIALARNFPLRLDALLNMLEVVAPSKHVDKLRQFCEMRMPPGFPVKLEVPLFPTITAIVTFDKFEYVDNLPQSLFDIPDTFTEDPTRFPDL